MTTTRYLSPTKIRLVISSSWVSKASLGPSHIRAAHLQITSVERILGSPAIRCFFFFSWALYLSAKAHADYRLERTGGRQTCLFPPLRTFSMPDTHSFIAFFLDRNFVPRNEATLGKPYLAICLTGRVFEHRCSDISSTQLILLL